MSNKSSSISSLFVYLFPLISRNTRSLCSQSLLTILVFVLLVAYLPCYSSSPTPKLSAITNNNNKIIDASNAFMYYPKGSRGDSSFLSSSVHQQPSPPFFSDQQRSHANQFLMSHVNNNQVIVPKWFTRFNNDDDIDDYVPADVLLTKRASYYHTGGSQHLKKRKQLTKPPMEVMNEIVNSIYLKR